MLNPSFFGRGEHMNVRCVSCGADLDAHRIFYLRFYQLTFSFDPMSIKGKVLDINDMTFDVMQRELNDKYNLFK